MKIVFAEKPSQAQDYAKVLGCNQRKDGYMVGTGFTVTWAFGHLIEICRPDEQNPEWKKPNMAKLPLIPVDWKFKVAEDKKSSLT